MRVVSVGDLVTDFYYKNEKLLGVNGGMTCHNIIANLAKQGVDTAVLGVCGNDSNGQIALKSLGDLGVDISNVVVLDSISTRCFHISYFENNNNLSFISKKRCPKCGKKNWYDESLIDCKYVMNNICDDDILVFDNMNDKNLFIINNTNNKKIIDLGQYFEFESLTKKEILEKFRANIEIINFNERVVKYLINKLNLNSEMDLFKLLKPNFMTITKGEKGATFFYDDKLYNFDLVNKTDVVDSTGAGDGFISSIVKDWINNNFIYDPDLFVLWYKNSNKLTSKIVSKMGARGHIKSLYKIKKKNDSCTCNDFSYVIRKQIRRCDINIKNLEARVRNALNSSALKKINNVKFSRTDNCIFIGTGGSFACSLFASKIINNLYGCNTYSLYPRDVMYRNNDIISKIILFSYSGTTSDIIMSINGFDRHNVYIVTKGEMKNVVLKTNICKDNVISYRTSSNKGKERGFLSFEGAVVPAALFLKYYYGIVDSMFNVDKFIKDCMYYWDKYFDDLFVNKKNFKDLKKGNLINIFRGDYTDTACCDLESKFIESGVFNCIIHEKKNFSHGRFINYEILNNNYSIFFKQKTTSPYEKELLNYLDCETTIVVESRYDGLLCEFDLLISSQFLIYYIGKMFDIDVSKPKYSDKSMNIYFYKGKL